MLVSDLIGLALRVTGVVGVGQTPTTSDTADCFAHLNMMLGQWSRRRWLVYQELDLAFVSTGAQSYTIGAAGNFVAPRVDRLLGGYARLVNYGQAQQADYPLEVIQSREDYAQIVLKAMPSFPCAVWLDPGYPMGVLHFWPIPQASLYELHVLAKADLAPFVTPADTIALPPEYQEALLYNLAARLRPLYGMPPDPTITVMAKTGLNTIRSANVQIPKARMALGVTPGWGAGAAGSFAVGGGSDDQDAVLYDTDGVVTSGLQP